MSEAFGLELGELPEDWQALEVIAVVKCLGPGEGTGAVKLSTRASESLNIWEAVGMLECAAADLKAQYLETLQPNDEL